MQIRNASYKDAPSIRILLENLGYKTSISLLVDKLETQFGSADHQVMVYELQKEVVGFVAVHFLRHLATNGDLALISYLMVDQEHRRKGIGKALEEYVTKLARHRRCEYIQLHCSEWRTEAHQFYKKQGYEDYTKHFIKNLVEGQ